MKKADIPVEDHDRITVVIKKPSSSPPPHPVDLVIERNGLVSETGSVSAFRVLPDGQRISLGIFSLDMSISEIFRFVR